MPGFASRIVSFTPGFSPVPDGRPLARNRFNGFPDFAKETVKTVSQQRAGLSTGLKPGVNKKDF